MSDWQIIPRETRDMLGEGTLWSARDHAVYWVDILAPALNRLSLSSGAIERWPLPEPIGWVVERTRGGFIAGLQSGFVELGLEPMAIRPLIDPEPHLAGNRMNDGKADADGYIWCGTMDMAEQHDAGALYRLAPDLSLKKMDDGYRVPNGPAFSADGKWLYHSDTARRTVYRFECLPDKTLGRREAFIEFTAEQGHPDGMTCDAKGGLWIAHWGGSRISRYGSNGQLDREIRLPARQITNITFAGERLDRMFVSSAAIGIDNPTAADGALFEVFAGAVGLPPGLFAG